MIIAEVAGGLANQMIIYAAARALSLLQNPEYTGHPIRFKLDTESGSNWTLNPVLTGQ